MNQPCDTVRQRCGWYLLTPLKVDCMVYAWTK